MPPPRLTDRQTLSTPPIMAGSVLRIDDELDVTPAFTFSTIQFSNDVVNTIVASFITVLILVNIGSAVSKLVYFTRTTSFSYKSWLRAFIFANSDDPLRVLAWLSRKYVYRESEWNRYPNRRRGSRLFLPLLARATILIASIASVAVTVPNVRDMEGCVNNDYQLRYDPTIADLNQRLLYPACLDVPLTTDRGEVTSTASYCMCLDLLVPNEAADPPSTRVKITPNATLGTITTRLENRTNIASYFFYVEWKRANSSLDGRTFRSDLVKTLDLEAHADLLLDVFRNSRFGASPCNRLNDFQDADGSISYDLDCEIQSFEIIYEVETYLRSAMTWKRIKPGNKQTRIELTADSRQGGSETPACPLDLKISRPLVNIVPLAIMLAVWVVFNLIVSFAARKHGNALDAGFHIVKEALGHDCTSNPLEKCMEREEVTHVELRKWRCGAGGAHVGFIGRDGDRPVDNFDESTIVSGCSRVAVELDRAISLATAPAGFAPPGAPTASVGSSQQVQDAMENGNAPGNAATHYHQPTN